MEIDQSLLEDFLIESKEHLETIKDDFLNLESQSDNPDKELIDKIFRSVHSIKGSSGFLDLGDITDLAHKMEALLQKMRENIIKPESEYIDVLLKGSDLLNEMLKDPLNASSIDSIEVKKQIEAMVNNAGKDVHEKEEIDEEEVEEIEENIDTIEDNKTEKDSIIKDKSIVEGQVEISELDKLGYSIEKHHLQLLQTKNFFLLKYDLNKLEEKNIYPASITMDLLSMGEIADCKFEYNIKNLSENFSEKPVIFNVLYITSLIKKSIPIVLNIGEKDIIEFNTGFKKELDQNKENYESILKEKKINNSKSNQRKNNNKIQPKDKNIQNNTVPDKKILQAHEQAETIRINVEILDKIMNLAGELVLVRNQHLMLVDKENAKQVDNSHRLDMVTTELQEAIMRTRMQPIGKIFSRLRRIVRDVSKSLKKSIIIILNGEDVELDKTILELLADPLTHIIRNSCDHGIELPEQRIKAGKSETGYITVKAYYEGGQVNVIIEDDGGGIKPESIKKKVVEKGLKEESELERMSEKDIVSLIMLPGFSTAEEVSEISGRGVGMDVVKTSVEQLSGSISLESKPGQGTIIYLRLPLTLAIIPSLIVTVGKERFAIPEVNVEELVSLYDEEIYTKVESDGVQEVFRLRNSLLPLVRLNEIISRPKPFTEDNRSEISEKYSIIAKEKLQELDDGEDHIMIFAVLKIGFLRFGLVIDDVIGTEEIVVNPLHSVIKPIKIYSGTTIMGDGIVALILDVNGIYLHTGIRFTRESEEQKTKEIGQTTSDTHRVLLFKNGEKEVFAVPLILMRRVELINPKKIQLIGDKEYISIDGVTTLILRLDNLLNVSPCLIQKKMYLLQPKELIKPLGILVSELIDVVYMPLELSKEEHMEEGILGTAYINDFITIFLNVFKLIEKFDSTKPKAITEHTLDESAKKDKKILILEDTVFFQRLVKTYLETEGYKVKLVENGIQGLEAMEDEKFDLIVSDIEMPEMNGNEFISIIRKNKIFKDIPAIAITSLDSLEDRNIGLKAGFNSYKSKIDREDLLYEVNKLISQK